MPSPTPSRRLPACPARGLLASRSYGGLESGARRLDHHHWRQPGLQCARRFEVRRRPAAARQVQGPLDRVRKRNRPGVRLERSRWRTRWKPGATYGRATELSRWRSRSSHPCTATKFFRPTSSSACFPALAGLAMNCCASTTQPARSSLTRSRSDAPCTTA